MIKFVFACKEEKKRGKNKSAKDRYGISCSCTPRLIKSNSTIAIIVISIPGLKVGMQYHFLPYLCFL